MPNVKTRRPIGTQPKNPIDINQIRAFNESLAFSQGTRVSVAASSATSQAISLTAAGKWLLGITIIPAAGTLTALGDTQITFAVNNSSIISLVPANNLNPNFVQGMKYFPTPQKLSGTDTITVVFNKNDAGAVTAYVTIFYIPRKI